MTSLWPGFPPPVCVRPRKDRKRTGARTVCPAKPENAVTAIAAKVLGKISTGLVPVRRSFSEGGSASFVRTLVARLTPQRPPHPAPHERDDRETPLLWGRDTKSSRCDLGWRRSGIFLQRAMDRLMGDLPVGQNHMQGARESLSSSDGLRDMFLHMPWGNPCPSKGTSNYSAMAAIKRSEFLWNSSCRAMKRSCTVTAIVWRSSRCANAGLSSCSRR